MCTYYADINSTTIDSWVVDGWQWGRPIDHETFLRAKNGDWAIKLTPTKPVPKAWFPDLAGAKVLGLACGGGQQMPVLTALGAQCTVLDYSEKQLEAEAMLSQREGYDIELIRADMSKPLPLADESFDMIFHPVSNSYVEDVMHIWAECNRVLKPGGVLLCGLDNGINYIFDADQAVVKNSLPFNPLKDETLYRQSITNNWGIQFSHTIEEQIGGQLQAGFMLCDVYGDTNGDGNLHEHNIVTFWATKAIKR